jgi:hypothetical protein
VKSNLLVATRNDSACLQAERCALYSDRFQVGGVSVRVYGDHPADLNLDPTLIPFRVGRGVSDVDIHVSWVDQLHPSLAGQLFDSGCVWRLHTNGTDLQFDFTTAEFGGVPYKRLLVDDQFRNASLLLSRECFKNPDTAIPLEYPLDELLIMHRLTQERAIELHGLGIVGPNGATNLFVGHSGAGKSTTARLWTSLHNVEILSDDRIILRRQDKLREDLVREDHIREAHAGPAQIFMYGTPWHGEAAFALPQRAPLQRIFVLEHGHGNLITRLTRSQIVAELFARSFVPFHRHQYVDAALSFLEQVADSVPCYRYCFEPDQRAVERVLNFRD